ncbi:MAG: hypothetical protein M0Z95_17915 [Actinomycetota bacterium]|jgi:hypothetical protein|nr:hypothetical protein [Actinomycetota bacterium]
MSTNTQPRQPSGTPVGGQFAGKANPEPDTQWDTDRYGGLRLEDVSGWRSLRFVVDSEGRIQDPTTGHQPCGNTAMMGRHIAPLPCEHEVSRWVGGDPARAGAPRCTR